jgi:hypothetical protein
MTRAAAVALVLTAALLGASCTGTAMAPSTADELSQGAAAVRAAVESGNRDAAEAALTSLRSSVDNLRRNEAISNDKAIDIVTAMNEVAAELDVMPTTTTTTVPIEDEDDEGGHKGPGGHGGGKDKSGKGHGKH